MAATGYRDLKTQLSTEMVGLNGTRSQGGFLKLTESNFPALPAGSCVCLQSIGYGKLQAGDYILVSCEGRLLVRRFVKLITVSDATRLVVVDESGQHESVACARLQGLISKVKAEGAPYNPNPQGFLQRAAFLLRHSFPRTA
jgi:hypothetical protein